MPDCWEHAVGILIAGCLLCLLTACGQDTSVADGLSRELADRTYAQYATCGPGSSSRAAWEAMMSETIQQTLTRR